MQNLQTSPFVPRLNPDDYLHVFRWKEEEALGRLEEIVCQHGYAQPEVAKGKYLYAPGSTPLLLVAHADTVFGNGRTKIEILRGEDDMGAYLTSPQGLGADDRAGIIGILHMLAHTAHRPSLLITLGEERGCIGAQAFAERHGSALAGSELRYAVELDRRGDMQAVFYLNNQVREFTRFVTGYGFRHEIGSSSDITRLQEYGLCAVNRSVGYYGEHRTTERWYPRHLDNTLAALSRMLADAPVARRFRFEV